MDTTKIVILKNLHHYDDYEGADFLVCGEDEITEGYLHDTYNRYGIALDEYEAGDYCLANSESVMASDIECAILSSKNFRPMLVAAMVEEDGDLFGDGSNEEDFKQWFDQAISIDTEGNVEINGEENAELTAFAKKYNEENTIYTEAKYINYWDGSNFQTLLLDADGYETAFEVLSEDDEEYKPIMEALEKYDTYIHEGICKSEVIGNYEISHSLYQEDHFYCISRV